MAGRLIEGTWTREGDVLASKDGHYHRQETDFRDWISREPGAKFAPRLDDITSMSVMPAPGHTGP